MMRAVAIQSDIGIPSNLCASLRSLADVLRAEERYSEARHVLQQVESLQAQHETDHCVKVLVQAELASLEVLLDQKNSARERLRGVVRTLRKRTRDGQHIVEALSDAICGLGELVAPARRLRRKTALECVQQRAE